MIPGHLLLTPGQKPAPILPIGNLTLNRSMVGFLLHLIGGFFGSRSGPMHGPPAGSLDLSSRSFRRFGDGLPRVFGSVLGFLSSLLHILPSGLCRQSRASAPEEEKSYGRFSD